MSAEQALANAVNQMSNLNKEVQRFRDTAMGLNAIYPTITEGRQAVDNGKYFSVPGNGAYMRLYRRQGSSAELIAEFPDRTELNSLIAQLGPLLGRGVVGGPGDLMVEGYQGLAGTAVMLSDFDLPPTRSRFVAGAGSGVTGKAPNNSAFWLGLEAYRSGNRAIRLLLESRGMHLRGWTNGQESMDLSFFHNENVVGPVSKSGEKQTGALFERDSNNDGSWFKTAGGRMVCQKGGSFTALESTNIDIVWDFPQEFFVTENNRLRAAQEIHVTLKIDGGAYDGNLSVGSHMLKEWRARCLSNSDAGKRVNVSFQVTGTTGSNRQGYYTLTAEGFWHE